MQPSPVIQVVIQRGDNDCAVVCLAMLAGVSYEEALIAIGEAEPKVMQKGVWRKHIAQAAAKFGYTLKAKRKYDLESDTGMLSFSDHVVVLREGLIVTTSGTIWDAEDFLAYYWSTYQDKPTTLWVLESKQKEN